MKDHIAMLVVIHLLASCSSPTCRESLFESIKAERQPENELRVDIDIETALPGSVYIRYRSVENGGNYSFSDTTANSNAHSITLSLLKPETKYSFVVIFNSGECQVEATLQTFDTGPIPVNLTPLKWQHFTSGIYNGYLLLQRRTPRGNVHLVDTDGEIVWYQKLEGIVKVSHWTDRNTILVLYGDQDHKNSEGNHLVEYDLDGEELLHLRLDSLNISTHHEVLLDSDDNPVMLIYESRVIDLGRVGGSKNQTITGDAIVVTDRNGKELWRWSVFDHFDPASDPDIMSDTDDWGHANALSYDNDGHFLLSFRDWNQVWKINSKTGEIIWKLGENGDFAIDSLFHFNGQHAIHRNSAGHYMLLDNGREKRKTTVLSFSLDEKNLTASPEIVIPLPDEYYADRMGSAYLIDNDHILVCSPRSRSLLILDPKGNIVSDAYVGVPDPYRAEYVKF